mmetsp:Transcript_20568/g.56781  ORF Transcript_20568/g.56781 Transcript_20568/m.56781 type:complete len:677 (+) Transcript_20568:131-2161(+)
MEQAAACEPYYYNTPQQEQSSSSLSLDSTVTPLAPPTVTLMMINNIVDCDSPAVSAGTKPSRSRRHCNKNRLTVSFRNANPPLRLHIAALLFALTLLLAGGSNTLVQAQQCYAPDPICEDPMIISIQAVQASGKTKLNQKNNVCRKKCKQSIKKKKSATHLAVWKKCAKLCRDYNKVNKFNTAASVCQKHNFCDGGGGVGEQDTSAPTPQPTPSSLDVVRYITGLLPDPSVLVDATSYQSLALDWIKNDYSSGTHSHDRVVQRFVLGCIFFATYQVETPYALQETGYIFPWYNQTGWLSSADECIGWHGITCDNQGLVSEIHLAKNFLSGRFPPEVAMIKDSLVRLDLFRNNFHNPGSEWTDFLGDLINLQELNIGETGFEYNGIPPSIRKLKNLVHLDISYCLFFGPLRNNIFANMPNLEYLYIGGNSFDSPIPPNFINLVSLKYFYAEFTDLTGDLGFFQYPQLQSELHEVWIDKNPKLTGNIPPQVGGYTNLASLSLTDLDLYGPIPSQLGDLDSMTQLWLYGNRLSGAIPEELSQLLLLERLELQDNDLTGDMPFAICETKWAQSKMKVLGADCNGEVSCNNNCCTCCGDECRPKRRKLEEQPQPEISMQAVAEQEDPNEKRRNLRHKERREWVTQLIQNPDLFREHAERKQRRLDFVARQRGQQQRPLLRS